jgi:hypothetical protein
MRPPQVKFHVSPFFANAKSVASGQEGGEFPRQTARDLLQLRKRGGGGGRVRDQ